MSMPHDELVIGESQQRGVKVPVHEAVLFVSVSAVGLLLIGSAFFATCRHDSAVV
jgi:hypothetical protein